MNIRYPFYVIIWRRIQYRWSRTWSRANSKIYKKRYTPRREDRIPPLLLPSEDGFSPPSPSHRTLWSLKRKRKVVIQTCNFLTIFPPEIRMMIYGYAIGNSTVHIIELKRRMAHIECSHGASVVVDVERACIPQVCAGQTKPTWSDDMEGWDWSFDVRLSCRLGLLQTCRQVYDEAGPLLYSTNTFDFTTAESFNFFVRTITSQRLATIRSLSIGLYTFNVTTPISPPRPNAVFQPSDVYDLTEDWGLAWETIRLHMYSLKYLSVLAHGGEADMPYLQEFVSEAVKGLKGLKAIHLELRQQIGVTIVNNLYPSFSIKNYALVDPLPSTVAHVQRVIGKNA